MSANRKSVFLSDHALDILGPFSSGRLNGIIEKYGHLIQTLRNFLVFSLAGVNDNIKVLSTVHLALMSPEFLVQR